MAEDSGHLLARSVRVFDYVSHLLLLATVVPLILLSSLSLVLLFAVRAAALL